MDDGSFSYFIEKKPMKICHLAITHDVLSDSRIMNRMACSSADAGHDVSVISSGVTAQKVGKVDLKSVSKRRLGRIWYPLLWVRCLIAALKERSDVYHIHEVPLMLCGLVLKLLGKSVVVDFHEDFEAELFEKQYLSKWLMWTFYYIYQPFKWILLRCFDYIIISEDSYKNNFRHVKKKLAVVRNHPRVDQFRFLESYPESEFRVIYVGAITEDRGCKNIIEAVKEIKSSGLMNISLTLVGRILDQGLQDYVEYEKIASTGSIRWNGSKPFSEIQQMLTEYSLGFAALHDNPNYRLSLPTKILEYNSAGLMCIASDLPITHSYVVENFNGQVVGPDQSSEIASAIVDIYVNHRYLNKIKIRDWVTKEFSWEKESLVLEDVYLRIKK